MNYLRWFLVLSWAAMLLSCVGASSQLQNSSVAQPTREVELHLIDHIWKFNEQLIVEAINRKSGPIDTRFTLAVNFFEEVTGILSDTGTLLGRVPTEGLRTTLSAWRDWYRLHRSQLRFRPDHSPIVTLALQDQSV